MRNVERRPQETSLSDLEQPAATLDSAPAPDAGTPDNTGLPDDSPELSGDGLDTQQTIEEIEEELEGIKLRGPKDALEKLKAERLMQADYTRKTQEVAEQRRSIEAERTQFQQTAQQHQAHIRDVAQVVALEEQLSQYANVDWQAWSAQDAAAASSAHMHFTSLQTRHGQMVNALTHKAQQGKLEAEQAIAKRANDSEAIVAREIKGWSPEKYSELQTYAKTNGIEAESLRQLLINVPQAAKFISKSMEHDRLLKQRMTKPPAPPAEPVTRIGAGNAAVTKDPARMSDAEFAAWRKRQIAQRP